MKEQQIRVIIKCKKYCNRLKRYKVLKRKINVTCPPLFYCREKFMSTNLVPQFSQKQHHYYHHHHQRYRQKQHIGNIPASLVQLGNIISYSKYSLQNVLNSIELNGGHHLYATDLTLACTPQYPALNYSTSIKLKYLIIIERYTRSRNDITPHSDTSSIPTAWQAIVQGATVPLPIDVTCVEASIIYILMSKRHQL
ncbi:hypothetical protein GQX74_014662 [Glossina fuscipes]|nr:hypothetical protein GQX74_014662 [Glossina fuscipes]